MSHSTTPSPSAGRVPPCPGWCDPNRCHTDDTDRSHRSTPVLVRTLGAHYTLNLVRHDEHAHPETWGDPPELEFQAVDRCFIREDGSALRVDVPIAMAELTGLMEALAGQLWLARLSNGARS